MVDTMKKRMNCFLPQLMGVACAMSCAGYAAANEGGFYLVPSVGYHMTEKLDHYKKVEKDNNHVGKIDFEDGMHYGLMFGLQTSGHTALEFGYGYSDFDLNAKWITGKAEPDHKHGVGFHHIHLDGIYYLSDIYENDFSLYIPIGIGYTKNDPGNAKIINDLKYKSIEDTAINFGLGAYYSFTEHFGLRGDVRGLYGISQSNLDLIVQVGLTFRFGGAAAPEPVALDPITQSATVHFALNSVEITNKNNPDLQIIANSLRNNNQARIKILTYSDRSGPSDYNMRLSEKRADHLKNILVNQFGVDPDKIYTKAFGDEGGLSRDRRAVAVVEYPN